MKIRIGFITNSSSTNFLIISKEELTPDLLFEKLGFVKSGMLEEEGKKLCESILRGADRGPRYFDREEWYYDYIEREFGKKAAKRYKKMKGYHVYCGCTDSDDSVLTQFFTMDSFEIEQKGLYINGRSCVW